MNPLLTRSTNQPRRRGRSSSTGLHVHWFRWMGDDPYSSASLYACRCGEIRPGF